MIESAVLPEFLKEEPRNIKNWISIDPKSTAQINKIPKKNGLELSVASIDSAHIQLPGVEPWTEVAVEVGEGQGA